MSDKSPLFVSASELLAHAIELYFEGIERKYKFVILHLANAIELILKDRVIDSGASIYKGPSTTTINIWEAFAILEKAAVKIPERPIIELLIDDRNNIQYRFGFPNGDATFYYLDQVLRFFQRFLKSEYDVNAVELLRLYVTDEHLATLGLVRRDDEVEPLDKLFELSPEAALLQAYSLVERKLYEHVLSHSEQNKRSAYPASALPRLLEQLASAGFLSSADVAGFRHLRDMRNRAAHAAHFSDAVPREAWREALNVSKRIIQAIERADKAGFLEQLKRERQRRKMELQASNSSTDTAIADEVAPEVDRRQHQAEVARRMRIARDAMPPLGMSVKELIEAGRER